MSLKGALVGMERERERAREREEREGGRREIENDDDKGGDNR